MCFFVWFVLFIESMWRMIGRNHVEAVIEPADGVAPSDDLAARLLVHCREHLAGFKVPRSVDFRDELPRYPTGKLYKRLLRDEYWKGHERAI